MAGGVGAPTPQPALNASIAPRAITADRAGNVYFADASQTVYKVDTKGVLTRVAGNGHPGYLGDGGPAVNAQLDAVTGLAVDTSGNLFIVCWVSGLTNNTGVRKVSPDGIITTYAGGGDKIRVDGGPALSESMSAVGIAVDSAGNVYITDNLTNCISKITTDGVIHIIGGYGPTGYTGDGGPATHAALSPNDLNGIAVDSAGNVYFVITKSYVSGDLGDCVRKISTSGIITSVAGGCAAKLSGLPFIDPFTNLTAIAADTAGNVYVGDGARVIQIIGGVSTFAGTSQGGFSGDGGPATSAKLGSVAAIAVDNKGGVYIADYSYRIRKVSPDGTINTISGNGLASYSGDGGPATAAQLNGPSAVAVDQSGNLYIADSGNCRVRMVSPDGIIRTVVGDGVCGLPAEGASAIKAHIGKPSGLALDSSGALYFSDITYPAVWRVSSDWTLHRVAGTTAYAHGAAGDGGPALQAGFSGPTGLAFDSSGILYVADVYDARVRMISSGGIISTVAGNGAPGDSGPGGRAADTGIGGALSIAFDHAGNLYIAASHLLKVSPNGTMSALTRCVASCAALGDSGVPASSLMINPAGIAVGNDGSVYITVSAFVYRITSDGTATVVAGNMAAALTYSGDGGPASSAGIQPNALATDNSGKIYAADAFNDVRLLQPVIPLTIANSASNVAGAIAPGEIVTLYGSGLGPTQLVKAVPASDGSYGTQLSGVTVNIGGLPAPLLYAWDTQTAAIVPYGISGSTAAVTVSFNGIATASTSVPITTAAPAIFTADSTGKGPAAALNQDNSLNSATSPAHVGDSIILFATGEGQTSPTGRDGQPAVSPLPQPLLQVTLTVGGQPATVQYAGGAPGEVAGVMQVNAQIPTGISAGNAVPIVLKVGNATASTVTIAIR